MQLVSSSVHNIQVEFEFDPLAEIFEGKLTINQHRLMAVHSNDSWGLSSSSSLNLSEKSEQSTSWRGGRVRGGVFFNIETILDGLATGFLALLRMRFQLYYLDAHQLYFLETSFACLTFWWAW